MARDYSAQDVLEILVGVLAGGRGQHNPENPILGIPSFGDALAEDRARQRGPPSRNRGRRDPGGPAARRGLLDGARSTKKKRRKISAYQREFGRQLKLLKKKHPRTPVQKLMKRAHAATKRARRGK